MISGCGAGMISTLTLHPLDVLKTRLQAHEWRNERNPISTAYKISTNEGWRAFYQGVAPAVWGAALSWGICLTVHEHLKNKIKQIYHVKDVGVMGNLVCASIGSSVAALFTNPIWLLKTRMELQTKYVKQGLPMGDREIYNGMIDGFRKVVRKEGVRGLYTGLIPALLLVSHGGIQIAFYEWLKAYYLSRSDSQHLKSSESLVAGASAKIFATFATYPLQVIKTRIQDQKNFDTKEYKGTVQAVYHIIRLDGLRGLYKGMTTNLLRVAPSAAITFTAYEQILSLFARLEHTSSTSTATATSSSSTTTSATINSTPAALKANRQPPQQLAKTQTNNKESNGGDSDDDDGDDDVNPALPSSSSPSDFE